MVVVVVVVVVGQRLWEWQGPGVAVVGPEAAALGLGQGPRRDRNPRRRTDDPQESKNCRNIYVVAAFRTLGVRFENGVRF